MKEGGRGPTYVLFGAVTWIEPWLKQFVKTQFEDEKHNAKEKMARQPTPNDEYFGTYRMADSTLRTRRNIIDISLRHRTIPGTILPFGPMRKRPSPSVMMKLGTSMRRLRTFLLFKGIH